LIALLPKVRHNNMTSEKWMLKNVKAPSGNFRDRERHHRLGRHHLGRAGTGSEARIEPPRVLRRPGRGAE